VAEINAGRGQHFDPDVVEAFLEIQAEFKHIGIENDDVGQAPAVPGPYASPPEP
jgi:HD-GYP domain-containing protein (c-di-GMP phosphodiesterase class II)